MDRETAQLHVRESTDSVDNEVILRLRNISKIYPGTVALYGVNLDIKKGEVHGIIGKNGAGKTTLVGIVAGLIKPTAGEIYINKNRYTELSRIVSKKENVAIVPQEPQLVQENSIAENLFMPDYITRANRIIINWPKLYEKAEEVLRKGNLDLSVHTRVKEIGIGLQQILLILKANYIEKAKIIILDEASSSMSEKEEELFYRIINERKREGGTIINISHRIDELLRICDRMTVLRDGRTIETVRREEVSKESISALIVGQPLTYNNAGIFPFAPEKSPGQDLPGDEKLLEVEGLSSLNKFSNISFYLRKNEVVGLAGLIGSGRTEILKAIYGVEPPESGTVRLGGELLNLDHPAKALQNKIAYLPEERDEEGLISILSIRANMVISALKRITQFFWISRKKEDKLINDLADKLDLKFSSFNQEVKELSGGNRQKVVIAKVLSTRPLVYLLDEPTKGIDISSKKSLLKIIREELLRDAGVVITAPGLEELLEVCNRILVLYKGKIVREYSRPEFDESTIYRVMQGSHIAEPAQSV